MRRALIFAHFDPHGMVDQHVLYTLVCYRQYFELIHFVSTSNLDRGQISNVCRLADRVIVRENVGYDFWSWRAGLEAIPRVDCYDEIIFANDSVYGPCNDFGLFWPKVQNLKVDLWGSSINEQFRPHVQSYFMGFGSRLIRSGFVKRFWSDVDNIEDKQQLILAYEAGLSNRVEEAGFSIGALIDYRNADKAVQRRVIADNHSEADKIGSELARINILTERLPNPMHLYWLESFRRGLPFLKTNLLKANPLHANLVNVHSALKVNAWYDLSLIANHLTRVTPGRLFPPPLAQSNADLVS